MGARIFIPDLGFTKCLPRLRVQKNVQIQKVANFDDAPTTRAITKRYNIRQRGRKYYSRSNAILNAQKGFVAALHAVAKVRCQIFRPFIRTNTVVVKKTNNFCVDSLG